MLKSQLIVPTIGIGIVASIVAKTLCEVLGIVEPWTSPFSGAVVALAVLGALAYYQRRLNARNGLLQPK
jgi:hypothetical protein